MQRRIFVLGLLGWSVVWPDAARAHSYKVGSIEIGHAWALPSRQTEGQVFMPMLNTGTVADSLVAARTDMASLIEFRPNNHYVDAPFKQVDAPITEFVLEPGKPFPMRPTAKHLRLLGLSKPLVAGDRFHMVLDFLNAGEIEIDVLVEDKPGE